jgi:hypothetical protein
MKIRKIPGRIRMNKRKIRMFKYNYRRKTRWIYTLKIYINHYKWVLTIYIKLSYIVFGLFNNYFFQKLLSNKSSDFFNF